jgi:glycosyltransferase involved in cell wall biosynthesis
MAGARRDLSLRMSLAMEVRAQSPYELDATPFEASPDLKSASIFFEGVLKGDYSLAIVNRFLARHLIKAGLDLTLFTPEAGWRGDPMLAEMPDVASRCAPAYPAAGAFDIHLRNTWPPQADDMIGKRLNAYVCFAWEELEVPRRIVDHFNAHLDLVMVTSDFVKTSLRLSGVTVPIEVVGNGTDHIFDYQPAPLPPDLSKGASARLLHVSSCFPRKAADRLVEAFARRFSKQDGVELLIKTFDNPHNTIEVDVARAKAANPDCAPILVVKRSLPYPQLIELMRTSDLLVAPSRGEGFGLPLAESMLLGTPVVTTHYSGQKDFCNDGTAWLVDYRMANSRAHVSSSAAQWADPDLGSLERQMARALADQKGSRDRVARAKALLSEHFKWSDVARRVQQSLEIRLATGRASAAALDISVDLVSTWSQACGVATYSEHLFAASALRPTLKRVLARELKGDEIDESLTPADGPPVSRPWGYDHDGLARLNSLLTEGGSDVLWMQHHPGFFSAPDMVEVARALDRSQYRLKAVTLHNVKEALNNRPQDWLGSFDVVFVHTESDLDYIDPVWRSRASVIPHGILSHPTPAPAGDGAFTIGTFGFLYPHKNVPMLIEALWIARRVEPRLRLTLLCCNRNNSQSWMERARVESAIERLGLTDAVDADFRFLADSEIAERLSRCDLICFPYGDSTESATGAARIALSMDRPLLCSRSTVLEDVLPYSLVLTELSAKTLAEALIVLATDANILGLRDDERRRFVARNTYDAIAERHMRVLRSRLNA